MRRFGWLSEESCSASLVVEDRSPGLPNGESNPRSLMVSRAHSLEEDNDTMGNSAPRTLVELPAQAEREPLSGTDVARYASKEDNGAMGNSVRRKFVEPPAHAVCEPLSGRHVARYASKDASGRVWGMPSAFGGGQCFKCPRKAASPSLMCEKCQLASAAGCEMPYHDLQHLQTTFSVVLRELPARAQHDIDTRLKHLYSKLEAGVVAVSIQVLLLDIATAMHKNDRVAASKNVASLIAEHWRQHKAWLIGLKQLTSRRSSAS
eukprot:CAMPEP_0117543698 /NCGR_PEP_ID=MMETSP0784-20121206/45193_1 /TAXON_ID=39447 /ORGANISM="" /LENGTH=262 /DNA_ID=CAMNT_0005340481 /DNA_START=133 /DNA_END=921 /DNA_ORIENTATION=+